MNQPDDVWIYVDSETGAVHAYDDQDAALNAAIDDPAPFIELVQIQRAVEPVGQRRRSWVSAPQLTIPAHWADGPDTAA